MIANMTFTKCQTKSGGWKNGHLFFCFSIWNLFAPGGGNLDRTAGSGSTFSLGPVDRTNRGWNHRAVLTLCFWA